MARPCTNKRCQFQLIFWLLRLAQLSHDHLAKCMNWNLFFCFSQSIKYFYCFFLLHFIFSSKVWAEEGIVDECAEEFSETSQMLAHAEDICGPYLWKVYDLLVMPPSFPYGGMENPCLTMITPTLLVSSCVANLLNMHLFVIKTENLFWFFLFLLASGRR